MKTICLSMILMKKKIDNHKMYQVRYVVKAKNVMDARRIAMKSEPDEIWIDPDWKESKNNQLAQAIGFTVDEPDD